MDLGKRLLEAIHLVSIGYQLRGLSEYLKTTLHRQLTDFKSSALGTIVPHSARKLKTLNLFDVYIDNIFFHKFIKVFTRMVRLLDVT